MCLKVKRLYKSLLFFIKYNKEIKIKLNLKWNIPSNAVQPASIYFLLFLFRGKSQSVKVMLNVAILSMDISKDRFYDMKAYPCHLKAMHL